MKEKSEKELARDRTVHTIISHTTPYDQEQMFGRMLLFRDAERARIFEAIHESQLEMSQIWEFLRSDQFCTLSGLHDWARRDANLVRLGLGLSAGNCLSRQLSGQQVVDNYWTI